MKNNRLWDIEKFQQVIEIINLGKLNGNPYSIIQLGSPNDPPLKGVVDLRGKTSLRESAAILQNCDFFLGFEGFLMHLARSVDCRSVIIYGGFAHSWQSGYICNENIDSKIDCAPCWKFNYCDRDRACMKAINVDDVLQASQRLLLRKGLPLEVESVCI
jgi:ADP-heptose:LPS heptosyltransferase